MPIQKRQNASGAPGGIPGGILGGIPDDLPDRILALIALDRPVQAHEIKTHLTFAPPTFDGMITVSRMAEMPAHPRKKHLKFANFRLIPANRFLQ